MGRIAPTVMVLISMLWIPVVQGATGLYNYLQSVQGYLAPPIFVVFFSLEYSWKRLNAKGVYGNDRGTGHWCVSYAGGHPGCLGWVKSYPEGSFLWIVTISIVQYFSILITIVSAIVMVVVSLFDGATRIRENQGADLRDHH